MGELETLFAQHDFDAYPVVDNGHMLGIVTKFDFLRAFAFTTGQLMPSYDAIMKRTVGDVMTEGVVHVEPATPLTRVLQLMVSLKIRSFPVFGPRPRIARHDLARRRHARAQRGDGRKVTYIRPPSPAARPAAPPRRRAP